MRKLTRSRKGSTMVLATLLIVIVTIAAGVLFYNVIMNSVTSMTTNVNKQMALLLIEGRGIDATTITALGSSPLRF